MMGPQGPLVAPARPKASLSPLHVTTIVFGVLGMVAWGVSTGFSLGYIFYSGILLIPFCVLIGANIGLTYVTCRVVFLITASSFPDSPGLSDLHRNAARLLTFSLVAMAVWGTSLDWVVQSEEITEEMFTDPLITLHVCSYSFVLGFIVTGLTGGLNTRISRKMGKVAPEIEASALPVQPPTSHLNPLMSQTDHHQHRPPPSSVHSYPYSTSPRHY